ncbi:MAG: holo-[acyl-carrier-protein] synthase [Candidatus Edwardsbacteria bacterium RIFOXYD12_FULL_50_11]|jgi:holo-[acyl-carrier protein] synthase|uniref:Holo-[acyl-carrier-protein] synthase n=1 Tax=Candidatus Edwardsbacteria bacterium GWF2_54_11 TaxID=1817851 RepID=A0A1F5RI45_9BACT|nr:MAG: holo-[acyl-carrier-protein] synthase [Candidatus Edwardsbacteria bacterium RifOxyC12_full_54_24]OGF07003.1 MAG: holo-[acyl-carrier-protein] synthase [Candidatus Edwardsbacteria bacterium RifOxyA12_full_54_48]OGF11031.1 MAG: holo-[acyl-carrier-protein] synthase [Candidatus Edwardsbacteria bacterium GWE2_54_12]OGF14068.1 MAG: holo-[acyl-carrier-protein] synthase [Candidatus Edwardsbacteria bacterium GWF2_54_11]OGF15977.1 MAG: holo-[acyl-carrier-protein] synthase [Candidatus Edwardsbacteri
MIFGIGADIVAVERFKKLKDKEEFLAQFLSSDELSHAPKINRDLFYASLFAVKESVLKALGCGLSRGSYWHDIRVTKDIRVSFSGRLLEMLPAGGGHSIHASVSEAGEFAVAYVIIENINK